MGRKQTGCIILSAMQHSMCYWAGSTDAVGIYVPSPDLESLARTPNGRPVVEGLAKLRLERRGCQAERTNTLAGIWSAGFQKGNNEAGGATKVKLSHMKEIREPPEDIRFLREVYNLCPEWVAWQIPFKLLNVPTLWWQLVHFHFLMEVYLAYRWHLKCRKWSSPNWRLEITEMAIN